MISPFQSVPALAEQSNHSERLEDIGHVRRLDLLVSGWFLGGYAAVHGVKKLFGAFAGHGLEAMAAGFGSIGLRSPKAMATSARLSQRS